MTALLEVRDVRKHFAARGARGAPGPLRAVDGVSFDVHEGEALGLVGESGCGKSTLARILVGLEPATSGSVRFDGHELVGLSTRGWKPYRRRVQMVFQDPYASLDPRQTVASILAEPLAIHRMGRPRERRVRALELLEAVGLGPEHLLRYPHEFSGGQRQRIGIARALALQPDLLVCDEPVSGLDVSVQAQIINLLADLRERFGLAYLFIAHDLAVVRHLCARVAVMYLGRIVECAGRDELFEDPQHPYTRALLSAIPRPDPQFERGRQRRVLTGEIPSPRAVPTGCPFHPRCPEKVHVPGERCASDVPGLTRRPGSAGRVCACHLDAVPAAT